MDRIAELDSIVAHYDLNTHPFYTDWRAGTLPVEKLKVYSSEYGAFVATIAEGWETLGEQHYAAEERVHEQLWAEFRHELGGEGRAKKPETFVLVTAAESLFAQPATAAGALYAFEAQQPITSKTKLDGLDEHYSMSDEAKEYFRVHADDFNEAEDLRVAIGKMSDEDFARTKTACSTVCSAMWGALDGVYYSA